MFSQLPYNLVWEGGEREIFTTHGNGGMLRRIMRLISIIANYPNTFYNYSPKKVNSIYNSIYVSTFPYHIKATKITKRYILTTIEVITPPFPKLLVDLPCLFLHQIYKTVEPFGLDFLAAKIYVSLTPVA